MEVLTNEAMAAEVPRMVTMKEAHEITGLSLEYLRAACANNEIVHIRCGRKKLINLGRLIDHMNGNC